MENLDALTKRALRAYRLGRLRMAARVTLLLLPVATLCLIEPAGREACACCAALLVTAAVWFRFRDRKGADAVTTGLLAGAVPLASGMILGAMDLGCATATSPSLCSGLSLVSGVLAGIFITLRESNNHGRVRSGWLPLLVAVLVGSMGHARLGATSIVATALGLIMGSLLARQARRFA
ncbi:MAG TPA: hypothetical protein VFQ61_23240 [Polyangiaceae bacterium]|nr:hypothetical protein [Polyangiaceae bacterium]